MANGKWGPALLPAPIPRPRLRLAARSGGVVPGRACCVRGGFPGAFRGAKPLGCCRSVLSPGPAALPSCRSFRMLANDMRPPPAPAPALAFCRIAPAPIVGVSSVPRRRSRPRLRCAGRSPASGSATCRPMPFHRRAPDGGQGPRRALLRKRRRVTPRFRSRRPQVRASASRPEGAWRVVTLQSFRVRIAARNSLRNQRFDPPFPRRFVRRHRKAAPLVRVAQAKNAGVIHSPRTLRWIALVQRRSAAISGPAAPAGEGAGR